MAETHALPPAARLSAAMAESGESDDGWMVEALAETEALLARRASGAGPAAEALEAHALLATVYGVGVSGRATDDEVAEAGAAAGAGAGAGAGAAAAGAGMSVDAALEAEAEEALLANRASVAGAADEAGALLDAFDAPTQGLPARELAELRAAHPARPLAALGGGPSAHPSAPPAPAAAELDLAPGHSSLALDYFYSVSMTTRDSTGAHNQTSGAGAPAGAGTGADADADAAHASGTAPTADAVGGHPAGDQSQTARENRGQDLTPVPVLAL